MNGEAATTSLEMANYFVLGLHILHMIIIQFVVMHPIETNSTRLTNSSFLFTDAHRH